jgi:hypothetical protein
MDGELRSIFAKNLRSAQWTPIETGMTMQGVPDSHYIFPGGYAGWVEHKQTDGWQIKKTKSWPFQVAWISRYTRMGGRAFVAVRRNKDELWLIPGKQVQALANHGLKAFVISGRLEGTYLTRFWTGGPRKWNWKEIEGVLRGDYGD